MSLEHHSRPVSWAPDIVSCPLACTEVVCLEGRSSSRQSEITAVHAFLIYIIEENILLMGLYQGAL